MHVLRSLALVVLLTGPALCGDLVITKKKHVDAQETPNGLQPAKDTTEVLWLGAERMRVEEGDALTLVRLDLKKLYRIDAKAKSYSVVELPFDAKKYLPEDMAPMLEQLSAQFQVTVTPTTETKKIQSWEATRHTMTMRVGGHGGAQQELWVVKGLGVERAGSREMFAALGVGSPFEAVIAAAMAQLDGLAVLVERTRRALGGEVHSREEVVSIEEREPAAGFYELPAGLTETPFDPLAELKANGQLQTEGAR
ncbi:MAG: hypothetical protein EXS08_11600 [Planctomycetes bacterium]|nr:hypothetical protein [Planctomycetota bacterium]